MKEHYILVSVDERSLHVAHGKTFCDGEVVPVEIDYEAATLNLAGLLAVYLTQPTAVNKGLEGHAKQIVDAALKGNT